MLITILYLLVLLTGMLAVYFAYPHFFAVFVPGEFEGRYSLRSVLIISTWLVLVYFGSMLFADKELGNRILHSLGGGVSVVLVSYLVVRDFKIKMPLRQLVILVFLVATALGVANEVLEFVIQETVGFGFAITVEDTWLDLVSNWAGAIAGLAVFSSAVRK